MVVIQLRGQMVALLVEAVGKGDVREATVRPLPRRLQRRVVRGAIVRQEDGQVALLIDPQEALAQLLAGAEIILRPAMLPTEPRTPAPWVLIVDDSVTIRRTLEQTLSAAGFKTSQARDGYEALEIMEHELPRVIILDVEMPRLSGFELLKLLRRSPQYAQVRVAMLTSRAADKHRDYALSIGADAYLVKPCPQETLVETIRRLLTESEPG
jgi:chemosensory pili system protein ChpA (sensor histidine kinase/response regulator)